MHNPDQHYTAHILHHKDLYKQAEHNRMITALTQHRHARVRAAVRRLGVLLMTLGTWLARSAQRDEQPTLAWGGACPGRNRMDGKWLSRCLYQPAPALSECITREAISPVLPYLCVARDSEESRRR
jgi:hypothetical protein